MNAPIRLALLPMGDLQHAIAHPDPDLWSALTPADLKDIRRRCTQHWTVWWMQLHPLRLFALVALALTVPVIARMPSQDWGELLWWRGVLTIVVLCAAVLTPLLLILLAACFSIFNLDRMSAVHDRLKAVPHAEYYSKFSLDTLAHSEGAQRYYDQIKAMGRDLCVLDFDVMLKLAAADRLSAAR